MLSQFLNPVMLLGLAGLALPVLIHLLNRKRYDVVEWGAMQFLELGRTTRRRLRLEQLLLMLLRMGLITLVVLAMARPWARGGIFSSLGKGQHRDVVVVVDGSYSMGWEGDGVTPHSRAVGWIHQFLEELQPGDTATLIDAREQPNVLLEEPTQDFSQLRTKTNELPAPAGTASLAAAVSQAARVLARTSNPSRDIIVLTDGQARGWSSEDSALWTRFDVLQDESRVRPDVWVVDLRQSEDQTAENFYVGQLELSREVTVAGFPIRVQTRIGGSGLNDSVARSVYFEVDGQRLGNQTVRVQVAPGQQAEIEFEHRFNDAGSHVVSVVIDDDGLPADNRSDAAVTVASAIPVLLVDGWPHQDPTQTETYFASAALTAKGNEAPWVRARVVSPQQFDAMALENIDVVVLANVGTLTAAQSELLSKYVHNGGGLLIAPGDHVDPAAFNAMLFAEGRGLSPAALDRIVASDKPAEGTHVRAGSLELPWLAAFRNGNDGGLLDARVTHWWKTIAAQAAHNDAAPKGNIDAAPAETKPIDDALIAARYQTDDAFLIVRAYGSGRVILMTVPLDADWTNLPAKSDYVALLHELVFHLASGRSERNVAVGATLVMPIAPSIVPSEYAFVLPGGNEKEGTLTGGEARRAVQLPDARTPGLYRFARRADAPKPAKPVPAEFFVVNCDRTESDLRPLSDEERAALTANNRMAFVADMKALKRDALADETQVEYWFVLMFAFLAILLSETLMARHLVKGGHAVVDEQTASFASGT